MRLFRPLLISISIVFFLTSEVNADASPFRTITTSGESIVYVTPDEVVVNFGVENFDEGLDKATARNEEQSAKLIKAIKGLGLEDKQIQTDLLRVDVLYKENSPWQGIRGYVARRAYIVTLKETKLFEKLVESALKSGANQINGFEFRTTELRKYRDQARAMAIKAAKENAVAMAKELECGVGKPWQISEGSNGYWGRYNPNSNSSQNVLFGGGGGQAEETLPPGQIAVRAEISVVFDLTDK